MSLNSLIDAAVEKNNDELVKSLQELIRINSVCSDPKPGMPFGEGAAKALENALALCANLGFRTKNLDNYIGYAEIGEGEEIFGIVVHRSTRRQWLALSAFQRNYCRRKNVWQRYY